MNYPSLKNDLEKLQLRKKKSNESFLRADFRCHQMHFDSARLLAILGVLFKEKNAKKTEIKSTD